MSHWNIQWRRVYVGKLSCCRLGKCSLSQTFQVVGNEEDHMSTLVRATPSFRRPSQEAGRLTGDWRLVYIK